MTTPTAHPPTERNLNEFRHYGVLYEEFENVKGARFDRKVTKVVLDLTEEPTIPFVILLPDGTQTTPKELVTRLLSLEGRIEALEKRQPEP